MGAIIPVNQVKITCKKKIVGVIENIDRFNRKKLNATTAKYIFYVKLIDGKSVNSQGEADAWKAEHPDIIGRNVKTCIKNAINDFADAYFCVLDYDDGENILDLICACKTRMRNETNYMLGADGFSLIINNGIVKFNSGY